MSIKQLWNETLFANVVTALATTLFVVLCEWLDKGYSPGKLIACAVLAVAITITIIFTYPAKRVAKAGIQDSFMESDEADKYSKKKWGEVKESYRYIGTTGASRLPDLENWIRRDENSRKTYHFLLLDPAADNVLEQLYRFEQAHKSDQSPDVTAYKTKMKNKLLVTKSTLESTRAHQEKRLTITYYQEYPTCWLEIFDNEEMIFGFLIPNKDGKYANALKIEKQNRTDDMFSFFLANYWRRLKGE